MELRAHIVAPTEGLEVVPAHPQREWMNEVFMPFREGETPSGKGFANRCLPMLMANQIGWHIKTTVPWFIRTNETENLDILCCAPKEPWCGPVSNFAHNIVTWPMPWVFETPAGWDLWIIPPPNDMLPLGVTVLSGIVETDHAHQTFTLNWKMPPLTSIFVPAETSIATIVPMPTALLAGWHLEEDNEVPENYPAFLERRKESIDRKSEHFGRWDKDYWNEAKRRKIGK